MHVFLQGMNDSPGGISIYVVHYLGCIFEENFRVDFPGKFQKRL